MPRFVITYDIRSDNNGRENSHSAFMNSALEHGWKQVIMISDGSVYRLPNTTFMFDADDASSARVQIDQVISRASTRKGLPVFVERYLMSIDPGGMPIYEDSSMRRTYLGV